MRKLRITGGEPLVRRDVMTLFRALGARIGTARPRRADADHQRHPVASDAPATGAAGVRRVNVSLDTLDPERFARITRWGKLDKVLDGIAPPRRPGCT